MLYTSLQGLHPNVTFPWDIPKWKSQNKTLVIPKLWPFISFSNQVYFENEKAISYSSQKDISNNV
jgi:hypothetical protein